MARRCCVHVWHDSGGLRTTALAASANGELVAAGSDSGAVSLYGSRSVLSSATPEARPYISPISPPYLPYISPTSPLVGHARGDPRDTPHLTLTLTLNLTLTLT